MQATNGNHATDNADGQPLLVVTPGEDGFDVYDPHDPSQIYAVSGDAIDPTCSCTDFAWKQNQTGYRCDHIRAVFKHLDDHDPGAEPERHDNGSVSPRLASDPGESYEEVSRLMTLKRSVSPDGRIDSLSIEFINPVAGEDSVEFERQVLEILDRQEQVVAAFMQRRSTGQGNAEKRGNGHQRENGRNGNGAVSAILRDIGGTETRYGYRFFVNVEVGRNVYRFFGTRQKVSDELASIGLRGVHINTGQMVDETCMAVLEKSKDGRYTNVVRLLPNGRDNGRGR